MNEVRYQEVYAQVGEQGIVELIHLRDWLEGRWTGTVRTAPIENPPWRPWASRYAPSIICRSEAELFGISSPRFAIRVALGEHSFVNLRRIASFCEQACHHLAPPPAARRTWSSRLPWNRTMRLLVKNRCIADALLEVPQRFRTGHFVITVRLGRAYGECEVADTDTPAVPYVRQIATGGGLCAQAAAFMAASLQHDHATGVHGIAEVTRLATEPRDEGLVLSGLVLEQLADYFAKTQVGLRALPQKTRIARSPEIELRADLRAYLLSKVPIIVPLDVGRMQGTRGRSADDPLRYAGSIFEHNGLKRDRGWTASTARTRTHAVVAVGCEADNQTNEFLFHDPARFPFMRATSEMLFSAGVYMSNGGTSAPPESGLFLPVTPARVRMPLSHPWPQGPHEMRPGIRQVAELLQSGAEMGMTLEFPMLERPGEFRLRRGTPAELADWLEADPSVVIERTVKTALTRALADRPSSELSRWVWVQWTPRSAWLWDAEQSPPTEATESGTALAYLLAAAWCQGTVVREWPVCWPLPQAVDQPRDRDPERAPTPPLRPDAEISRQGVEISVLTSFSVRGLDEVQENWPTNCEACELYAFMQADAERLLDFPGIEEDLRRERHQLDRLWIKTLNFLRRNRQRFGWHGFAPPRTLHPLAWLRAARHAVARRNPLAELPIPLPERTAQERMARLCGDDARIDRIAREIERFVEARGLRLVAFASFLPGLADYAQETVRRNTVLSVRFLLQLARRLKDGPCCPDLRTVELVGGSLIKGISYRREAQEQTYFAQCLDPGRALAQLIESLLAIEREEQVAAAGLELALEHEPGPLYVLGNWDRICTFCQKLDEQDPQCSLAIGLNVDIAHWGFLSGFPCGPSLPGFVSRRLVHAHVSSHGRGHFGDAPVELGGPDCLRTINEFGPWFDLFLRLGAAPGRTFSGYASLELEACKSPRMLLDSVKNLRTIRGTR